MAIMNNHYKVLLYKNFKNAERYEWACHVTYLDSFVIVIIVVATKLLCIIIKIAEKKCVGRAWSSKMCVHSHLLFRFEFFY